MRVLAIGVSGTIGRPLCEALEMRGHEVVRAGRNGHDLAVGTRSAESIETMYKNAGTIDACLCVAESGALDSFEELTEDMLLENMRGKLFGSRTLTACSCPLTARVVECGIAVERSLDVGDFRKPG